MYKSTYFVTIVHVQLYLVKMMSEMKVLVFILAIVCYYEAVAITCIKCTTKDDCNENGGLDQVLVSGCEDGVTNCISYIFTTEDDPKTKMLTNECAPKGEADKVCAILEKKETEQKKKILQCVTCDSRLCNNDLVIESDESKSV